MTDDHQQFEDDYARLIHTGISNDARIGYEGTEEKNRRWETEVAEPWWHAMRERARYDGLRIECFRGGDAQLSSVAFDPLIAAAELVRPDRRAYSQRWIKDEHERAEMAADWGETLRTARERHPYDFAFERKRDSDRAAALRQLDEIDLTSLQSNRRLLGRGRPLRYVLLRSIAIGLIASTVMSLLTQLTGK